MKRILAIVMAVAIALTSAGCTNNSNNDTVGSSEIASSTESAEKVVINLGVMGSIDVLPLVIAQENGYFDANGLEVNVEMFRAAKDRDAALQAGAIDGVTSDQVAISLYQNAGIDMKITGITDGEFVLVAGKDSGIEHAADLIGKKIAISENTVIEFSVDQILGRAGLAVDSVEKVVIPSMPTRLELLNSGEVDAALMPSPFSDAAIAAGGVVIERIDSKGQYISVVAFLNAFIEMNPEAIKGFYRAYNEAVDYLNQTDVSVYEDVVIRVVGYPETMKGNILVPTFRKNQLPPESELLQVLEWANQKCLLSKVVTPEDMLSTIGIEE